MSFTITGKQTNSAAPISMLVKVLTGASATQPGSTASSNDSCSLSITPNDTGSWIYGTFQQPPAYLKGALSGTTYEVQDTTYFGTSLTAIYARSTGTTTANTPITIGDQNTTDLPLSDTDGYGVALVEIVADGTLAEDSSAPAFVGSTSATSVTTAIFSPPSDSLLVVMLNTWNELGGITDTSGQGLTWTIQATEGGYATIYTAYVTTGGGTSAFTSGIGAAISDAGGIGIPGLYTTAAYGASYDVGTGTGSWVNPTNAEGEPDGSFATWTAP